MTVNPDFKFKFETDEELKKAQMANYIPLCDIVRINFYNKKHQIKIDHPVKSREAYIRDFETLNNDDNITILNVYQDKWYYDINEHD